MRCGPSTTAMTSFLSVLRKALARRPSTSVVEGAAVRPVATLRVRSAAHSDTGPVRAGNEDCVRCVLEDAGALGERVSLAIVADGMGGHQAGEVASATAVAVITDAWRSRSSNDTARVLRTAIARAGAEVFAAASKRRDWEGMGTTVTVLAVVGDEAHVGYVGDSRAYLMRDGALQALTVDDTLVNHLLRTGAIQPAQAANHPDRGVLSQALGTRAAVPDIHLAPALALRAGDLFLLCSDGLHDVLSDAVLAQMLAQAHGPAATAATDLGALARRLVQAAVAAGTQDNISVVLLAADAPGGAAAPVPLRPTRPFPVTQGRGP